MRPGDVVPWLLLGVGGFVAWRIWSRGSATVTRANNAIFESVTAPAGDAIAAIANTVARGVGYARERLAGVLDLDALREFRAIRSGQPYRITLADAYKFNTAPGRATDGNAMSPQSAADARAYAQFVAAAVGVPNNWRPR